jgi:GntR family transcriptional regulator, transcriptional repressor for pyruvate dehydrogenase complex
MTEVVRQSLSDALTERVLGLIRDEGLRAGDRLPSARAMAERFAVATPTLREVLRRLEATGAVEIRHGSGVYVGEAMSRIVLPNPNPPSLHRDQLLQLLDARLLMEPHLAGLAAQRRDPSRLATLEDILSTAERHLSGQAGDDAALHEANMAFHRGIAAASGNEVLYEVIDSLLWVHASEQVEILQLFDDRVRDHEEHRAVQAAIVSGDPDQASHLMRAHLEDVKSVISKKERRNRS